MWLTYDKASDVLTIHGKRYAASMFGHEGFLAPVGTLLRVEHSPHPETVTLAIVQPVQEPVAWRFEARHIDSAWGAAVSLKHPGPEGVYMRNVVPLYAAPPQRKPLTEEKLRDVLRQVAEGIDAPNIVMTHWPLVARAVEAAHGIKEGT